MSGLLVAGVAVEHRLGVAAPHTLLPAVAVHKLPPAGEVVLCILALVAAHNMALLVWLAG